nr:unnamed protein product [Callosobruchus analis]
MATKVQQQLLASGKDNKDDNVKIAILLNLMGENGLIIYNTFDYTEDEERNKLQTVLQKFDAYCNPIKNLVYEHFKFFNRKRLPNETEDQFITALRHLASTCEFKENDLMIRDRIVIGIKNSRIQERLLQEANLTLAEAIKISRSMESSVATQRVMAEEEAKEENSVSVIKSKSRNKWPPSKSHKEKSPPNKARNAPGFPNDSNTCKYCGLQHQKGQCPAFNRTSSRCSKKGHYRKFCRSKWMHNVECNESDPPSDGSDSEESECDSYSETSDKSHSSHRKQVVWTITTSSVSSIEWYEVIGIEDTEVNLKIDTGSQREPFQKGCSIATVSNTHQGKNSELNKLLTKYKKVFSGIGKVNRTYSITLMDTAIPRICAARKIPIALKDKVKEKIDLMRLAVRLLRYQFTLEYVPGKKMQVPDTLSRDPYPENVDTSYLDINLMVHSVLTTSTNNEERLKMAISNDAVFKLLTYYTCYGWPAHRNSVPPEVKRYWTIKDDIYSHKDVLLYKKRLLVPTALRLEFLGLLHKSHQGVVSCKRRAQETVYWPGITVDIEKLVLSCQICQEYSRSNQKEPLTPHEVPMLPWQKIGIDFKSFDGLDFIVIIDYFSKFAVVNKVTSKTSKTVISTLKNIFATHGLPMEIFSDNGPPFNSEDFSKFAKTYDITLTTSSPTYPQSNGMVERTNSTVKCLLAKSFREGEDPFLAILNYNITPKQDLPAPCDLLMGRKLRNTMPVLRDHLQRKFPIEGIREKLLDKQKDMVRQYNKSAKRLPPLSAYQDVLIQKRPRLWKPATVVQKSGPNDFMVKTEDGGEYRRNRRHLRPLRKPLNTEDDNNDEDPCICCSQPAEPPEVDTPDEQDASDSQSAVKDKLHTRSGREVRRPKKLDL